MLHSLNDGSQLAGSKLKQLQPLHHTLDFKMVEYNTINPVTNAFYAISGVVTLAKSTTRRCNVLTSGSK
jgi:hypothetical protein